MSEALKNKVATVAPKATNIDVQSFSINDYIGWFEKINLNTFIWQIIALVTIFYFGKEIRLLLKGIISKIPHIKSMAGVEFQLSEVTKNEIDEKKDALGKEIAPYMVAIEQDPNMVFLNHFIEFERNLDKLYWEALPGARDFMRESPAKMLESLVRAEILDDKALSAYYDIRKIRNEVVHGKSAFKGIEDAKPYLQAVFLLKSLINEGLEKELHKQEKKKKP